MIHALLIAESLLGLGVARWLLRLPSRAVDEPLSDEVDGVNFGFNHAGLVD